VSLPGTAHGGPSYIQLTLTVCVRIRFAPEGVEKGWATIGDGLISHLYGKRAGFARPYMLLHLDIGQDL
jgi:hypothetical protein